MKLKSLLLAAAVALLSLTATAQTNTPIDAQTFLQSVKGYFATFNTNLASTFATDTIDIWTAAEYVNNQNTAASLGFSFNAIKLSSVTIGFESVTRNAGIAGVILSQGAGINLQKVYVDTKVVGYVEGGYDFSLSRPYGEVGARIFKAIDSNTYAGIGIGERFGSKQVSNFPVLSIFAGFKL